jgi:hypothetical protein
MVPGWSASSQGDDVPDPPPGTSIEPSSGGNWPHSSKSHYMLNLSVPQDQPDLLAELENLYRENKGLLRKLEIAHDAAMVARRAQLIVDEKLRRQSEILEESRHATDIAVKEQSQVSAKLTELQKWTDSIDDDDVVRVMRRLF